MLHLSAAKFLGKQAVKKSIYSLIKQKTDDRKERLVEIRIVVVCFQMHSFAPTIYKLLIGAYFISDYCANLFHYDATSCHLNEK